MQIFLHSHTRSFFPGNQSYGRILGFTLIELLISVSIIGIISAIVIVKYGAFDSTIILKSQAYEIALALRETQVKSVSVLRSTGFDFPYGMTFSAGDPTTDLPDKKKYIAYSYASSDITVPPKYDIAIATVLQEFSIPRSLYVSDVCATVTDNNNNTSETCASSSSNPINRLDISFRRPEYKSIFYAELSSGGSLGSPTEPITSAKIKLRALDGLNTIFVVRVGMFGDFSVCKEGVSGC